jgi:hypothetical protein
MKLELPVISAVFAMLILASNAGSAMGDDAEVSLKSFRDMTAITRTGLHPPELTILHSHSVSYEPLAAVLSPYLLVDGPDWQAMSPEGREAVLTNARASAGFVPVFVIDPSTGQVWAVPPHDFVEDVHLLFMPWTSAEIDRLPLSVAPTDSGQEARRTNDPRSKITKDEMTSP